LETLSLAAFTTAFLLVVLAEMGDKTQFVAMTFAAKYNPWKVLFAIFLGTVANFLIVIAVGQVLIDFVPLTAVSLAASIAFIGFGLWSLRKEKSQDKEIKLKRLGIIATVAITFFLAEFGDKTQLATLSLTVQRQSPISVLVGATLAMLVADGIGIIIGVVFCRRIPQRIFKGISAVIFVLFGLVGFYEVLSPIVGVGYAVSATGALAVSSALVAYTIIRKNRKQTYVVSR
jgi:Ca2+/H+ antiporter, TMEM165/GDT1 family